MSSQLENIQQRISDRIGSYFAELTGHPRKVELTGIRKGAYSTIYFFRIPEAPQSNARRPGIAVKVFSNGKSDLAGLQYSSLVSVSQAFAASSSFALPRPLDFFPDISAVVTEEVAGTSLQEMFYEQRWPGRSSKEFVQACAQAAKWLRFFHKTTRSPAGPLDLEKKCSQAQENLRRFREYGLPKRLCRNILSVLEGQASKLRGVQMQTALVHGDFTVDNVLFIDGRVVALDLSGKDRNAVYHDVATFVNSLRFLLLTWPFSGRSVRAASEAFLAGYFENERYNREAITFLRLTGMISSALEILNRRRRNPLASAWIRFFFSKEMKRLMQN